MTSTARGEVCEPRDGKPVPTRYGLRRWLVPYFGVLFFVAHVALALARHSDALRDPGVGWHLQAGRLVLETGAPPRVDAFSYTAAGKPWLDYYWLFQALSALCERAGGLPLVATVWMLVYACIPLVLYRNTVRSGASPLAALLIVPLAHTVLLSHAVTRPHIVTYLAFAVLMGSLADIEEDRVPAWRLWWLPLVAMVWANMHGGFVAGLGAVAAATLGATLQAAVERNPRAWSHARSFAVLFVVMGLATLLTPYGIALHRQAIEHVRQASTGRFVEFLSPDFRGGGAAVGCFEVLVLATVALGALRHVQPTWAVVTLLVGTLHLALQSVRNMNLFVIVATPLVACGCSRVLAAGWPRLYARWQAVAAEQEVGPAWRTQAILVSVLCIALALHGRLPFPNTLDGMQMSAGAIAYVDAHADRFERLFNTDGLGGVLIYRFWPRLRVFVDDRTPVYGEAFMHEYFTVFDAQAGWEQVLDTWGVTMAIAATETAIAPVLRTSPVWNVEYEDGQTLIVSRRGSSTP